MVPTLLAQVVLTSRSVSFGKDGSVLTAVEWNRIYSVTSRNRIIASCFGIIIISQFILGLTMTAEAAKGGCTSVIQRPPRLLLTTLFLASPVLPVPLPIYMVCTFEGRLSVEIGFLTMSLTYGAELLVLHQ